MGILGVVCIGAVLILVWGGGLGIGSVVILEVGRYKVSVNIGGREV